MFTRPSKRNAKAEAAYDVKIEKHYSWAAEVHRKSDGLVLRLTAQTEWGIHRRTSRRQLDRRFARVDRLRAQKRPQHHER